MAAMPLAEGVYFLENTGTDGSTRLDLTDGKWNLGQLQAWDHADTVQSNGFRNQRWLITKVPGDEEFYHITNLFYGCQVGVYRRERESSWLVKAAPTTTLEESTQWSIKRISDDDWHIGWRPSLPPLAETFRLLGVGYGMKHGDVLAWKHNNKAWQSWRLVGDPNIASTVTDRSNWMKHITDDTIKLSMLNILGTHQSIALHGKNRQGHEGSSNVDKRLFDNPRCQNRSPYEQMLDGVRSFDFRFSTWLENGWTAGPSLFAWHGRDSNIIGAAEGYSFLAVLQSVKLFLQQFPTETIIMDVRNETNRPEYEACFRADFSGFEHLFFPNNMFGKHSINQISLADVRGRAVLLMNDEQHWRTPWRDVPQIHSRGHFLHGNGITLSEESKWNTMKPFWGTKLRNCRANVNHARQDHDPSHVYLTTFNLSRAPLYNPCEFAAYAKSTIEDIFDESNIGKGGTRRTGIVLFDFYELLPKSCLNIIRSNPGCAHIE